MIKVPKILRNIFNKTMKNDFQGLASQMAFDISLSLFPFIIFVVALFGIVGTVGTVDKIIQPLAPIAPPDALNLLESILKQVVQAKFNGIIGVLGLLGTLWAASRAVLTIINGIDKAYGIEETRSYIMINKMAIVTTLLIALILFISINLTVFFFVIFDFLKKSFPLFQTICSIASFSRWPIIFLTSFGISIVMYYYLPNITSHKKLLFRSSACGALFFSAFWLVSSWLFTIYAENFGKFNTVYGTLAGFIILLVWLYYTSLIMLIGGAISSEIYYLLIERKSKGKV